MQNAVAVFDSGLGGLTAVRALAELLPAPDILYLGDTARVPYGTRSAETIVRFAREAISFLRGFHPAAYVIACGTVSTVALPLLEADAPLVGVVEPSVRQAAALTRNGRVGLIATPASIRSGAYEGAMQRHRPDIRMTSHDGRLLVPLVEAGRIHAEDPVLRLLLEEYLQPFIDADVDTLILGCTHYPLLAPLIQAMLGPGVRLVNTGAAAASAVAALPGLQTDGTRRGRRKYFVTEDSEGFAVQASLFLQEDVIGEVERVELSAP